MGNKLSLNTVVEKNKLSSSVPFLACIQVQISDPDTGKLVETQYYVRNTEEILFKGNLYKPANFDISISSEANAQPTVSLNLSDYTQEIQSKMQEYAGGVGFKVKFLVLNADDLTSNAEIERDFEVIGASASEYAVSFTLGSRNIAMVDLPQRRQTKNFCQWRYKDPATCKYSGTMESCDLTLQGPNGCAAHNNTRNFGGFPGINVRLFKS